MRSIIEEIAAAEQQAEEIRQAAAVSAREKTARASEEAEAALEALRADCRLAMAEALKQAELDGEQLARTLSDGMDAEADAACAEAEKRLDSTVSYLMRKVRMA